MIGLVLIACAGVPVASADASRDPVTTGLALLVGNAGNLDPEEQAAVAFAGEQGVAVTVVDPAMVTSNPDLLTQYAGYWADSNAEPAGWNDPAVIGKLKTEIEGGKRLYVQAGGSYIGQYLGYGTAKTQSWSPSVTDQIFLVDYNEGDHPVLQGLMKWNPPTTPDNPAQMLLQVKKAGTYSFIYYEGKDPVKTGAVVLYTRYGFTSGPPSTALDATYGISSTGDRFLRQDTILNVQAAGLGSIVSGVPGLTREWTYGPMEKILLRNSLVWVGQGTLSAVPVTPTQKAGVGKVTLSGDPAEFFSGETTFLSGSVTDPQGNGLPEKQVVIKASRDDGISWQTSDFLLTDNTGRFSSFWLPMENRVYWVKAVADGIESPDVVIKVLNTMPCWNELEPDGSLPSGLTTFDWRNAGGKNYLTPVKDQGECGSCWEHATTGAIEALYNIEQKRNVALDLSEQELISCNPRVRGCHGIGFFGGGWPFDALDWIKQNGIVDETCFPYSSTLASTPSCSLCNDYLSRSYAITGYHQVYPLTTENIKKALYCHGPLPTGADWMEIGIEDGTGYVKWQHHAFLLVGWDDTYQGGSWIWKDSEGVNNPKTDHGYVYTKYDCRWEECSESNFLPRLCFMKSDHTYWIEGVKKL